MLEKHPEEVEALRVPKKEYPIRLWYMHDNTLCTIIDVDEVKQLVLKDLDLPFYDPFMIIEKTQGRMAEDNFWIKIER